MWRAESSRRQDWKGGGKWDVVGAKITQTSGLAARACVDWVG